MVERRGWFCRSLVALVALSLLGGCAGLSVPRGPVAANEARTGPGVPNGPVRVALLVPMNSGDAEKNAIGQSLVNAAKLAQGDLQGAEIELRIYPASGNPAEATASATRALAEGAQVILGPLFGVDAQAVGPVAAQKGLKVLTFSTTPGVAGRNVFLLGLTAQTEAERLAAFAKSRGIRSLAVFHSSQPGGRVAGQAIRAAANGVGLPLQAVTEFPWSREGIDAKAPGFARANTADAIVIPEGATTLTTAARIISRNGVDPKTTRLLGLGQWNAPATLKEDALEGGWFVAPDPALFNGFLTRYRATYGAEPSPIASLAYDGVAAIGALIREARQTRDADPFSVANLTDPGGFVGVNGVFRLRPNGMIDRALAVMEVEANGFRVVDPAPRGFAPPGS